jgi:hypothetical protein
MATLAWNIKLLGNLTERDFIAWKTAANIPSIYSFDVTTQDMKTNPSYWDDEHQESTLLAPETDNTIVITGREGVVDFDPYCYAGSRCVMMAQKDDFTTGTEVFALMLTCDGLLSRDVLDKIMNTVDLGEWIKKYQPSALAAYNNRSTLVGIDGYIDEESPEGEKLKNAICQYVVKVLALGTSPATTTIPTTGTQTTSSTTTQTPAALYLLAGGAAVAIALSYILYREMKPQ